MVDSCAGNGDNAADGLISWRRAPYPLVCAGLYGVVAMSLSDVFSCNMKHKDRFTVVLFVNDGHFSGLVSYGDGDGHVLSLRVLNLKSDNSVR